MKRDSITILAVAAVLIFSFPVFAHSRHTKLVPSDVNANDKFGGTVAIDGNFAVVGACQNDSSGSDTGAAYVFENTGSAWVQRQKLIAGDAFANDQFGKSVAIEANTIVIGSWYDNSKAGSAYIFTRSAGVWSQQAKLTASDAATNDKFGVSVSISKDTVVVGAYGDNSSAGSAYVFVRDGSTWTFEQKLTASDAASSDFFGSYIAIDVNTIFVGAYWDDHYIDEYSIRFNAGSCYVYEREGTTWTEQSILRASDANENDYFGCSVALDGNVAVIGAYECDYGGVTQAGAAYIFTKSGSTWSEQQKLIDTGDPCDGEDFGRAVAIEADVIFIGSPYYQVDGNMTGSVFEFVKTGENWAQNDLLLADDSNDNDNFGCVVAACGPNLIVGAQFNSDSGLNSGAAYAFCDAPVTPVADFDGDYDVDFADFAFLGSSWKQNDPLRDIAPPPSGDGIVDIYDLAIFCDNWLEGK